jgi:hypothetical protein
MIVARKMFAGSAEILSLVVFVVMIWMWGAVLSGPQV